MAWPWRARVERVNGGGAIAHGAGLLERLGLRLDPGADAALDEAA